MSSDRRRLNLSLSMQSPQQREAWKVLRAIPLGQRTDAVCRMVCRAQEQEALLDAVRKAIREELEKFHIEQRINVTGYVIEAIGRRLHAVDEALCREEAA